MKIISLTAENIKRLVAVEIRPDGNLVEITGRNGQGKTSVLDSIMWAIEGAKHIQAEPIRKGATAARIRLDLGELKIQRTFARDEVDGSTTSKLLVMSADGASYPSPQGMLDALLNALCFDPLAFARAEPKEQFNMLRKFVPGVDFAQIVMDNKDDEDERKGINRLLKQARESAKTAAAGLPENIPEEAPDEGELVKRLQEAGEANALLERQRAELARIAKEAADADNLAISQVSEARRLREQADELEERAAGNQRRAASLRGNLTDIGELPEPVNTQAITQALADARATAVWVRKRDEARKLTVSADNLEARSKAITARMRKREEDKQKAIAAAKMPVEGIGFGEDCITLNGVPFEQGSDAEQLMASVRIAMAMAPKLRVIRIRDGSLLDQDAMKLLGQLADEHDLQIWVERVDSSGQIGFVIEDGYVRKAEQVTTREVAESPGLFDGR
jgi:AAA domain